MTRGRLAAGLLVTAGFMAGLEAAQAPRWADLPAAVQRRLNANGLAAGSLADYLQAHARRTAERVRESDFDALIYYALQARTFTNDPPIEPALDAKAFVEALPAESRARFLGGQPVPTDRVPGATRRRLAALANALGSPTPGGRLGYFRDVIRTATSRTGEADALPLLLAHYVRAMRFLYQKEFVAAQRSDSASAVAALYRDRALSTDTAVEAGYLTYLGLAMVAAVDPDWRAQRVLIVGPGLDLAARTGLLEIGDPESYQPFAAIDALLALGLARAERLAVIGGDVNPRVVDYLNRARSRTAPLTLVTSLREADSVRFEDDFRQYFTELGRKIGELLPAPAFADGSRGHLRKSIGVSTAVSGVISGSTLDIVSGRPAGDPFDLVVVTNVFPYLDDVELTLALANIAAMLRPGGVLLHNESRPLAGEITSELGLPLTHSRSAVLARVPGSTPHYDSVFVHVKSPGP